MELNTFKIGDEYIRTPKRKIDIQNLWDRYKREREGSSRDCDMSRRYLWFIDWLVGNRDAERWSPEAERLDSYLQ